MGKDRVAAEPQRTRVYGIVSTKKHEAAVQCRLYEPLFNIRRSQVSAHSAVSSPRQPALTVHTTPFHAPNRIYIPAIFIHCTGPRCAGIAIFDYTNMVSGRTLSSRCVRNIAMPPGLPLATSLQHISIVGTKRVNTLC